MRINTNFMNNLVVLLKNKEIFINKKYYKEVVMKDATNFLIECPEFIPSVKLGVYDILKYSETKKKCKVRFVETMNITEKDIVWCDVLITVRGSETITKYIVLLAKEVGRKVIYFLDDDLLNIPYNIVSTSYYSRDRIKKNMISILENSDYLWCVNESIGEKYSKIGNLPWIKLNVPVEEVIDSNQTKEKIKFIYAGSVDHYNAVKLYLVPAVKKICEEYKDNVEFYFIGVNPKINYENIFFFKYIDDYEDYRDLMKSLNIDVGLAPIFTDDFYKMKYHNKYIEYGQYGACGIFTDSEPYNNIISNGENGLLCNNDIISWYEAMECFIKNTSLLSYCKKNVNIDLKRNYNIEVILKELDEKLVEFISYKSAVVNPKEIKIISKTHRFFIKIYEIIEIYKYKSLWIIPYKLLKKFF